MKKTFDQKIESILRFDKIRLHKLIELSQYSILACLLTIKIGKFVNHIIPAHDPKETLFETYMYVILNIIAMIVSVYYVRKIVLLVPYIFRFDTDYIVSKHDESLLGESIGFGIVFATTQIKLKQRIMIL